MVVFDGSYGAGALAERFGSTLGFGMEVVTSGQESTFPSCSSFSGISSAQVLQNVSGQVGEDAGLHSLAKSVEQDSSDATTGDETCRAGGTSFWFAWA